MSSSRTGRAVAAMALICLGSPASGADLSRETEAVRQHVAQRLLVDLEDVEVLHLGLSAGMACGEASEFVVESSPGENFLGHADLRITGLEANLTCGSARVRSRIRVWKTVPILEVQTQAGDEVLLGQARVKMEEIHGIPVETGSGPWEARMDMAKGTVVTTNRVRAMPDSRSGDSVIIEAGKGSLSVTAQGRLMEDGQVGERVRVANLATNQVMFAVLIEPGRVRAGGE